MIVERTITIRKEVKRCYHECPYFGTEEMEHAMVCEHPKAPTRFIIYHPACDKGFPDLCPLINDFELQKKMYKLYEQMKKEKL
jgi:fructosamine-3-kinase